MICAITCSIKREHNWAGDFLYGNYTDFFEKYGIKLVKLSNFSGSVTDYLNDLRINGLIISGGNSIGDEPERDKLEKALLDAAVTKAMPVLGICRGMQFINYYFSGNPTLKIAKDVKGAAKHAGTDHVVDIVHPDWQNLFDAKKIKVNSYHNEGYMSDKISRHLDITALGVDGVVEGIKHKKLPIIGIQWHPERPGQDEKSNKAVIKIFKDLFLTYVNGGGI